jgi:hypothetical protein
VLPKSPNVVLTRGWSGWSAAYLGGVPGIPGIPEAGFDKPRLAVFTKPVFLFLRSSIISVYPMVSTWQKFGLAVALCATLYQWYIKDFLFVTIGLGRTLQTLGEFPFNCRRLHHENLEGCEDLWLDDEARVLYAACSGSIARSQWNQG